MKSKSLLACLLLICLALLIACKKEVPDEKTVADENISVTQAPSQATPESNTEVEEGKNDENELGQLSSDELLLLSKIFAEEMVNGDFKNVTSIFTESVKETVSEEYLKDVWNKTVDPLGSYIDIFSQEVVEGDSFITTKTVLSFEKNGLLLTISFDKDQKIQGIWFSYQTIEEEQLSESINEIDIQIGENELLLDGKLTVPRGVSNPPVVILVQGSGQSDLDETIGAVSNKPFRDIAWGLAEKGIASIRYNKRFYEYADKASVNSTIYDEVLDDVSSAIAYATRDERVDGSKIYIVGHSLGGMLAPKIAFDNKEVVGIVSLAGSPRNLEDIIYDQVNNALAAQSNLTEEEKTYALSQYEEAVKSIKKLGNDNLQEAILGASGYYWKSLNEIETKKIVKELTIPMLFLQGSEDFQVFADIDFEEWKTLLEGKENVSFVLYDNLNHLFMPSNGLKDISEYDVEGNVDGKVIEDIAEWILIRK